MSEVEREAEILKGLKALREPEPIVPTEEPEAINVDEVQPVNEPEEVTDPIIGEAVETNTEEEAPVYYEIDGEEISLSDIRGWREGNLRQSDYTRKTQVAADQLKKAESLQSEVSTRANALEDVAKALETMLFTDKVDYEVDESGFPIYEDDIAKHQKHLHSQQQTRNQLSQAQQAIQAQKQADRQRVLAEENQKLMEALPTWGDPKQRQADLDIMTSYLDKAGIPKEKVNGLTDHKDWLTHLYAAKWIELQRTKTSVADKVVKAPKVIKPSKTKLKPTASTNLEDAKKALSSSGSKEDFMKAMKAMRG